MEEGWREEGVKEGWRRGGKGWGERRGGWRREGRGGVGGKEGRGEGSRGGKRGAELAPSGWDLAPCRCHLAPSFACPSGTSGGRDSNPRRSGGGSLSVEDAVSSPRREAFTPNVALEPRGSGVVAPSGSEAWIFHRSRFFTALTTKSL